MKGLNALILLLFIGLLLSACSNATQVPALPPVTVKSQSFFVNNQEFKFIGANAIYFGFYKQYGYSIPEAIHSAKESGIKVLRIYLWLGSGPWGGRPMEEYDRVLDIAAQEGMYIIAVLSDCTPGDWGKTKEAYYNVVPQCNLVQPSGIKIYEDRVAELINRRNTVNGKIYREDTTILAWDLANEPPLYDFTADEFHQWLSQVARYVKKLDPQHLITIGLSNQPKEYDGAGPLYDAWNVPELDFFSFHIYVSQRVRSDQICQSVEHLSLISKRTQILASYGKPVVLEEYGFGSLREIGGKETQDQRPDTMKCWLKVYKDQMDAAYSNGASGTMFWGWGVPETVNVPLWWKNEEHDSSETQFVDFLRTYQFPETSFDKKP